MPNYNKYEIKIKTLIFFILICTTVLKTYAEPMNIQESLIDDLTENQKTKKKLIDHLKQGIQYFETKKYDSAEAEFKKILNLNPKNTIAYFNLGLTKYKQGLYPEAIEYFDIVTKMHSYYVGASFYYKSISQVNLEQPEEAIKTAKQYKKENFFYQPLQRLIAAIENGTDEYFENAKDAAADGNYELCLLEINQSVLSDTYKGRELITKCIVDLKRATSRETFKIEDEKNYYKLYFDTYISQTDNVYQKNKNALSKQVYFAEIGGEYLFKNTIDIGFGFNYNHLNAVDLPRFKAERFSLSIPTSYRSNGNYMGITPFYDLNKHVGEDSYSDAGISLFYYHLDKKNYRLGLYGSTAKRTSLSTDFDYRAGTINYAKLFASRYIDELSISANVAFEQNNIGDLKMGSFVLPYANNTIIYGLGASYDFNRFSVLNLRYSLAVKDYVHIFLPNQSDRRDEQTRSVLSYHYMFNENIKVFLQQSFIKNKSNYDEHAFINKNYDENITAIGLSFLAY